MDRIRNRRWFSATGAAPHWTPIGQEFGSVGVGTYCRADNGICLRALRGTRTRALGEVFVQRALVHRNMKKLTAGRIFDLPARSNRASCRRVVGTMAYVRFNRCDVQHGTGRPKSEVPHPVKYRFRPAQSPNERILIRRFRGLHFGLCTAELVLQNDRMIMREFECRFPAATSGG